MIRSPTCVGPCPSLLGELGPQDELIVVDNASKDGLSDGAREPRTVSEAPRACPSNSASRRVRTSASRAARGELLVLLNPDAAVRPGWGAAIRRPWGGHWGGLDGPGAAGRRRADQHQRRRPALHGLRVGRPVGQPIAAAPRDAVRGGVPLGCVPGHPAGEVERSSVAFRSSSSCTARTSTCR